MTNIHPHYQRALKAALDSIQCEGKVELAEGYLYLSCSLKEATLSCLVDGSGNVVLIRHSETSSPVIRGLLDLLCRWAMEKPLREVAEHGVAYVELGMRDSEQKPPVQGIITPKNADPGFVVLLRLVRGLYQRFEKIHGVDQSKNFWCQSPRPGWKAMSDLSRHKKVQEVLALGCHELGLSSLLVEVIEIRHTTRVVLSLSQAPKDKSLGIYLIQLERILKRDLEPTLEIVLESTEDKNQRSTRTQLSRESSQDSSVNL